MQPLTNKGIRLPYIPDYATNNAHMFYIVCKSLEQRNKIIEVCKQYQVNTVFHYLSLHKSPYFLQHHGNTGDLPVSDQYTDCLLRLPFYYELTDGDIRRVVDAVRLAIE
jgi:dTDP-4-amino-4,6-dideoxygalactose transaminase